MRAARSGIVFPRREEFPRPGRRGVLGRRRSTIGSSGLLADQPALLDREEEEGSLVDGYIFDGDRLLGLQRVAATRFLHELGHLLRLAEDNYLDGHSVTYFEFIINA